MHKANTLFGIKEKLMKDWERRECTQTLFLIGLKTCVKD